MQHDAIKPAAGPSTTNLALGACTSCIFVWMLDASGDGAIRPRHYVQWCENPLHVSCPECNTLL